MAMMVAGRNFLVLGAALFIVSPFGLFFGRFYGDNDQACRFLRGTGNIFLIGLNPASQSEKFLPAGSPS
jgi:hypothetical protein